MTDPGERARECAEKILPYFDFLKAPDHVNLREDGIVFLATLIQAALDAEREACAGVCESGKSSVPADADFNAGCDECAAAIRARGEG